MLTTRLTNDGKQYGNKISKKQHFRIFLVSYCFFGFCCLHFKALLKNNQSIYSYPTIKHSRIVCSRQNPIDIVMLAKRERQPKSRLGLLQ